jgi:DNA-binding ferritin-like protein
MSKFESKKNFNFYSIYKTVSFYFFYKNENLEKKLKLANETIENQAGHIKRLKDEHKQVCNEKRDAVNNSQNLLDKIEEKVFKNIKSCLI